MEFCASLVCMPEDIPQVCLLVTCTAHNEKAQCSLLQPSYIWLLLLNFQILFLGPFTFVLHALKSSYIRPCLVGKTF
jgi:hypothetical protein